MLLLQHRVDRLVRAYRERGHIQARVDPLSQTVHYVPELDPQYYGFGDADLGKSFICETLQPEGRLTLGVLIRRLQEIYCGSIGYQYLHLDDGKMRHWLQQRIEAHDYWEPVSRAMQVRILTRLTDAVVFEQFVRKKFVGAKSFSLEGGESLIPLLDLAIERASQQGVREIVLGMAHRGRLNVLVNIIGKSPQQIFREFEDRDPDLYRGGGDVKYHLGYSGDYQTEGGQPVHLSLCFNPSHLEFVNPVVLGRVRAKQERAQDAEGRQVMNLLIHGDAAFTGEGVVLTPKSLLRDPRATSPLAECATGGFQRVLLDPRRLSLKTATRVLLCSGTMYFDLDTERVKRGREDVAIIRLEQLYPFPRAELEAQLADCRDGTHVIWVQEEPENMGAWRYLRVTCTLSFLGRLPCTGICRSASASPATGSHAAHLAEQQELLERAFRDDHPSQRPHTETVFGLKTPTIPP